MAGDPTIRAMLIASLRASRRADIKRLTAATLAGAILEQTSNIADALEMCRSAYEYLTRVELDEKATADTMPSFPAGPRIGGVR